MWEEVPGFRPALPRLPSQSTDAPIWGEIHLIHICYLCKYEKKHIFCLIVFQLVYLGNWLFRKLPLGTFAPGGLTVSPHTVADHHAGEGSDVQVTNVSVGLTTPPPQLSVNDLGRFLIWAIHLAPLLEYGKDIESSSEQFLNC